MNFECEGEKHDFVQNIHRWMIFGMHSLCKQKEEGGGNSPTSNSSYILIQFTICSFIITLLLMTLCKTKVRPSLVSQPVRDFKKQWSWSLCKHAISGMMSTLRALSNGPLLQIWIHGIDLSWGHRWRTLWIGWLPRKRYFRCILLSQRPMKIVHMLRVY